MTIPDKLIAIGGSHIVSLRRTGTLSIIAATFTDVTWDIEDSDAQGVHAGSSADISIPVAGLWSFTYRGWWGGPGTVAFHTPTVTNGYWVNNTSGFRTDAGDHFCFTYHIFYYLPGSFKITVDSQSNGSNTQLNQLQLVAARLAPA